MKAPVVQAKNVPECLRAIDSWLLWRLKKGKKADGSEAWLKVPYYADGSKRRGALGTKQDRARLVSFKQAVQVYKAGGWAGIGFATMPDYPLTILDLDGCVDDMGMFSEFAQKVVRTHTYVEYSPSGRGLRAVYEGEAVCAGKRNGLIANGERVEIYCGSAFVTITGDVLQDCDTPKKLPGRIKTALEPVISGAGMHGSEEAAREVDGEVLMSPDAMPIPNFSIDHARVILDKLPETWGQPGHGTWYRVAAALHLQFDGSEEAYALLDEWSQGLDGYDQDANRQRWQAGFSHSAGKHGLTTMRNLVFEAKESGGLKVKPDTMQKWGLSRKVEEDFGDEDDEDKHTVLPEYAELNRMTDIRRLAENDAPPIEWLIEDFLPRGVVSTLAGASGTSKSFLALQMCGRGAAGMKDFAGLKIKDGGFSSLYFAYEDPEILVHRRVQLVTNHVVDAEDLLDDEGMREEVRNNICQNLMMLTADLLDSGDWQFVKRTKKFDELKVTGLAEYLREYIVMRGIDLLVLDTGSETHSVEENNAQDMVVLMRVFRQLAASTGIAILILQHVSKPTLEKRLSEIHQGAIRGSSVLVDKSRNVFYLTRLPRADTAMFGLPNDARTADNYVILKHLKANMGDYVPMRVFDRTSNGLLRYCENLKEVDPALADTEAADDERGERLIERSTRYDSIVLEMIKEFNKVDRPSTTALVAQGSRRGVDEREVRNAVLRLEADGKIKNMGTNLRPQWGIVAAGKKDMPEPSGSPI